MTAKNDSQTAGRLRTSAHNRGIWDLPIELQQTLMDVWGRVPRGLQNRLPGAVETYWVRFSIHPRQLWPACRQSRPGSRRAGDRSVTRPSVEASVGCEQGFPGAFVERIHPAQPRDSVKPRVRADDCGYAVGEAGGCMYAIVGAEVRGAE